MNRNYDLAVIGAGSAGLTAARFAAQLGVRVGLVEKERVGGDCTWTGCVPSKALLKVAKVAHQARNAAQYGICTAPPAVDMPKVRAYVRGAMADVYRHETPERLAEEGIEVLFGAARFLDPYTLQVSEETVLAKKFIIATGARPHIPEIPGLSETPFLTYLQLFDNDELPGRLIVLGAGPIGVEMAQAYQRLGSEVTLIAEQLLPQDEPEARDSLRKVFVREGVRFVSGLASAVRQDGSEIEVTVRDQAYRGDMLLVATGRTPVVNGMDLDNAGVATFPQGVLVDDKLQTTAPHIYAAGDCVGGHQFTHLAGWQGFVAARNALLPGSDNGFDQSVPWTTFTDPEVAHVGLSEGEARERYGDAVRVAIWHMDQTDRAVADNRPDGFVKVIHKRDGTLLGATIVSGRAGEAIMEFVVALKQGLKMRDLATTIHVYPTYSTGVMRLAGNVALGELLSGLSGRLVRSFAR